MMGPMLSAVFWVTSSAAAAGLVAILSADAAAYTIAQQTLGISAETPVSGITIGAIIVGLVGSVGALLACGRYLIRIGGDLQQWRMALNDAVALTRLVQSAQKQVDLNTETLQHVQDEVAALSRWRALVDPILTELQIRTGTQRRDLAGG